MPPTPHARRPAPAVWTAVAVTVAPPLADAVASFLLDHGAPGLQLEEGDGATCVTAHFVPPAPLAELEHFLGALREIHPDAGRPEVALATITDTGWADNWKAHFPPLHIGQQLFVHPPWIDDVPAGRLGIVLDPGMAFGTGQHASTRGCLLWLEEAVRDRAAARVLDVGTGSGILAIAAAKLGAAAVTAIDTDPDACAAACANIAANRVADVVHLGRTLAAEPGPFDVVLANLLAGTLVELAAPLAQRLDAGGWLIGAGIQSEEVDAVAAAWRAAGLSELRHRHDEGWAALVARRSR